MVAAVRDEEDQFLIGRLSEWLFRGRYDSRLPLFAIGALCCRMEDSGLMSAAPYTKGQALVRRIARRPFYVVAALLCTFMAALGFLPRMIRAAVAGTIPREWIIHAHVAVYWTWLVLFFVQTVNAALGRVQAHKKLGVVLVGYGVVMFIAGVGVTLNRLLKQIRAGDLALAQSANLAPVVDMLVFPILLGLGIYYRRRPEVHKRLMILATTQLLYPAVVRMDFSPQYYWVVLAVWSAPVVLGMAHDWLTRRLVHPVYVTGMLLLALLTMRPNWIASRPWVEATTRLASIAGKAEPSRQ